MHNPKYFHVQAEQARERGEYEQALILTDQALIAYQQDGDLAGMAEVLSSRQRVFKHLYRSTKDETYLILEEHTAQAALHIAHISNIPQALAIPLHLMGSFFAQKKDYAQAAGYFKQAVENLRTYTENPHSRPAVIADFAGHQFWAEYLAGDLSALDKAYEVLEQLKNTSEDSYNQAVWVSGAHLRLAEMLATTDPQKAKQHLEEARSIIEADSRLVLRKEQLTELELLMSN